MVRVVRGTAVLTAVYALPAAAVAFAGVPTAFALAVGVLPAAAVGLLPTLYGLALPALLRRGGKR